MKKSPILKLILTVGGVIFIVILVICWKYSADFQEGFMQTRESTRYWISLQGCSEWAIALEKYHTVNNEYPESNSIDELKAILIPYRETDYALRTVDAWEEKYIITSSIDQYTISSKGNDKIGEHEYGGAIDTDNFSHSITLRNGVFSQYLKAKTKAVKEFEENIRNLKQS